MFTDTITSCFNSLSCRFSSILANFPYSRFDRIEKSDSSSSRVERTQKNMRESKIKTRWNTSPFNYLHLLIVFSHHAFFSRAVRFIISHFNEFSVVSAFFFWRNLMVSLSVMPFVILYTSNEPTRQLNCNTLISIRWSEPHCLAVIQPEIFFSTEMRQILKDFELVFDV